MSQSGVSLLVGEDAAAVLFVVADADSYLVHKTERRELTTLHNDGVALRVAQAQSSLQAANQQDAATDEACEGDAYTYYI
jgi:hypothetical protein